MMQAIAQSGAGMSASSIHLPVFGLQPVVLAGTQEQKQRMLPPVVRGEDRVCSAVTEPNVGLPRERIVFNRPIGMNQGIQHPLAKCWAQLEAANPMAMKAATLFDQRRQCGVEANTSKHLAGESLSGPVPTARSDVVVIVTEFGAAELQGQTLAERTRHLMNIAHPAFREELDRAAQVIRQRGF